LTISAVKALREEIDRQVAFEFLQLVEAVSIPWRKKSSPVLQAARRIMMGAGGELVHPREVVPPEVQARLDDAMAQARESVKKLKGQ